MLDNLPRNILDLKERNIEEYLRVSFKKAGGKAYKFRSPQNRAVADRICCLRGAVFFVECKAPGKKLTATQENFSEEVRSMGAHAWMVDTKEKVDFLIAVYG